MSSRTIALGAVTKGFDLKEHVREQLNNQGHSVLDIGCFSKDKFVTYTSIGEAIAHTLHTGDADFGVFICNYGTSSSVGVSKFQSVCSISCESVTTAQAARKVNNANVLCMGASVVSPELACEMVNEFIGAEFLDIPGVPEKLRDFRKQASEQAMLRGEIPASRELRGFE